MGKRARIPSPTASSQESDSSQESNKWHSDYQDEGHESSPRKRRRSSASSSEEEKVASQPNISTASLSRIKAKKPELLQPTAEKQESVSAVLTAQEKTDFSDLGVAPWLVASLAAMQIKRPTGIQKACIPEIIKGRDCIGGSRTGSGKTVAFMTPILQKWSEDPVGIFAVILTPTRELALQIFEQVKAVSSPVSLKPCLVTGGSDHRAQALALAQRPHIVIATPGRLADHIDTSGEDTICGLRKVRFLVLDEADRLLSTGNGSMVPDLETCLDVLPPSTERQTLLFTATVTPEVRAVAKNPRPAGRPPFYVCEVDTEVLAVPATLQQKYIQVPVTHRESYLHTLLLTPANLHKSVIIFCNRTTTATLLEHMLRLLEHRVTSLHSALPQSQRISNLARFRARAARILVATDVAARGLDIPEVAMVIHYDLPRDPDDYIHRSGRTARAGRTGESVSIVGQRDVELVLAIEERVGENMVEYEEEGVSIEGRVIRDALKAVGEKKREAMLQIEEGRDVAGNRQKGMQKRAKT